MSDDELPWCTCAACWRRCQCIAMPDGMVYKPFMWEFQSPEALEGICGNCVMVMDATDLTSIDRTIEMLIASGVSRELLAKWRTFRTAYMERVGKKLDRVTVLR